MTMHQLHQLHQLHDCLTAFLARIKPLDGTDLHDTFVGEVIRTGGTYMDPPKGDDATSHLFEISLHNVVGRGDNPQQAFADWTKAAQRMAKRMLDDPISGASQSDTPVGQRAPSNEGALA